MKTLPPPKNWNWIFLSEPSWCNSIWKPTKQNPSGPSVSWRGFTHTIFPPNHQPFQATFIPKNHIQSALADVKCRPKRFFGRKRLGFPFSPNEPEDVWEESLGGDNQCWKLFVFKVSRYSLRKQTKVPLKNSATGRQAFPFEMARLLGTCWFSGGCTPRFKRTQLKWLSMLRPNGKRSSKQLIWVVLSSLLARELWLKHKAQAQL